MVDLPHTRRNPSPQKQPPAPQPSDQTADAAEPAGHAEPAAHAEPAEHAEPVKSMPVLETSLSVPQEAQRPFSSRPDGPIGWIKPDEVATFSAASSPGMASACPQASSSSGLQPLAECQTTESSTSLQAEQPSTSSCISSQMLPSCHATADDENRTDGENQSEASSSNAAELSQAVAGFLSSADAITAGKEPGTMRERG